MLILIIISSKSSKDKKQMSVTSKNDRRRNYDYGGSDDGINDKLVSTIKGHHRFVKVVDGEKKYIDIYTTRYTPGSKIRCATSGHIYNDCKVGSHDEDYFFKVCLSGLVPENSYGKFLYFSSPLDYEHHFNVLVDNNIKNAWKIKYDQRVDRET
jgi:hypothetical protein